MHGGRGGEREGVVRPVSGWEAQSAACGWRVGLEENEDMVSFSKFCNLLAVYD